LNGSERTWHNPGMTRTRQLVSGETRTIHVDVFLGAAPLLEVRLVEGLLDFGRAHPHWRFSLRSADFRYSASWFRQHRLDGVLILIDGTHIERALKAAGKPFVRLVPGTSGPLACVGVDDAAIGRMGADYLLGRGFLKCAFCGVGTAWSDRRHAGFLSRIEAAAWESRFIDIPFVPGHSWSLGAAGVRRLARWLAACEPGTAVMAAHDALANRIVDICRRQGIRVPQDVAVLGVGNHALLCELSPVPISSIDAAVPLVAIRGAELLAGLLSGAETAESRTVAPSGIVERRSTETTGYGDNIVAQVAAYIRERIPTLTGVDEVADAFPVSRRTLDRRFVKYAGHSLAAEIRLSRLRLARERVCQTEETFSDIAAACGYADLSHMDRAFKMAFGQPPSLLRRIH